VGPKREKKKEKILKYSFKFKRPGGALAGLRKIHA
jgi:hypothetical protein